MTKPLLAIQLLALLSSCAHAPAQPSRALPSTRAWPCAYIWPEFQNQPTRVRLTKPVCRESAPVSVIRRVLDSTVLVRVDRYDPVKKKLMPFVGTGSVIRRDGTVVTAHHVIRDACSVSVLHRRLSADGRSYEFGDLVFMDVVAKTVTHDAAILTPVFPVEWSPPPLPVCRRQPRYGDVLWHVGYRVAWSIGSVGRSPIVFDETDEAMNVRGFGYVTLGYFGDSGGPIFDGAGRLHGLYVALQESWPQNGFGVTLDGAFRAMNFHADIETCD